jgi:hypothetical protein
MNNRKEKKENDFIQINKKHWYARTKEREREIFEEKFCSGVEKKYRGDNYYCQSSSSSSLCRAKRNVFVFSEQVHIFFIGQKKNFAADIVQ